MTAALGAWVARRKRAKLYLDIRDIFVDTIGEVLPPSVAWLVKPVFSATERFAVGAADRVNLVSAGFADYFRGRYPTQRFSFYTNGVDDEFVASASDIVASPEPQTQPSVRVLYAGNLGDGQGLHSIVPALAQRLAPRVSFQIVGDGGRKRDLEAELARRGVSNVELSAPMNRSELLAAYRRADVLFVHLNNLDAFKKVLPSKVFEVRGARQAGVGRCRGLRGGIRPHGNRKRRCFPPVRRGGGGPRLRVAAPRGYAASGIYREVRADEHQLGDGERDHRRRSSCVVT